MRKGLIAAACMAVLTIASPRAAGAQTADPAFRADIEKLLRISGATAIGAQMATVMAGQTIDAMKRTQPDVPDRVSDIVRLVLSDELGKMFDGPDGLFAKMVDVYARHFTHDEVNGLIAFYGSELGRKTVAELPAITTEGAAAGQQWAMANTPRITAVLEKRLRDEGFIK